MNLDTSTRPVVIGCDLFLDLEMYRVPHETLSTLSKDFPNVSLSPVNCPVSIEPPDSMEIYWGNRITQDIVKTSPNLRWIHFGSVGTNHANYPEILRRNIIVTNSRGLVTAPMVATCLAFVTNLARGFHHLAGLRKTGSFSRESYDRHFSEISDLEGQTVLIVGAGQIGQSLAPVLKALGMIVIGVRRSSERLDHFDGLFAPDQLVDAVSQADFIINLLPLTADTQEVFDSELFARMKTSAFFINLGRGESVVEPDLIDALESGQIAGAGLDVFQNEPLKDDSPLLRLPNVMLSPHVGAVSQAYWPKQTQLFTKNLSAYLEGRFEDMINVVRLEAKD